MSDQNLELIDLASSLFEDGELEDVYIIGVQHILGTTHTMLRSLYKKGLSPQNISLMGKCYSTVPKVFQAMVDEGIDVCPSSMVFDSHLSFDEQFRQSIEHFLFQRKSRLLDAQKQRQLIIIDEGGELLSQFETIIGSFFGVVGVEQTSSGYHKLKEVRNLCPVVNLARSKKKMEVETPIIIQTAVDTLRAKLKLFSLRVKKVLILGNGILGHEVDRLLSNHFSVSCCDVDPAKSDFLVEELPIYLPNFDLVIGCTGKTSISVEYHKFLKAGCLLVSLSSSDREFDAVFLRRKLPKSGIFAQDLEVETIRLFNSGFPVNFNGREELEGEERIQFTRAMILISILQALRMRGKGGEGFVDLDMKLQNIIADKYLSGRSQEKDLIVQ